MTEERIGGISVAVGGTLADLAAALEQAEKMVAAATARMDKMATVTIGGTVRGGASNSTRASAGTSGTSDLGPFTRAVSEATTRLTAFSAALSSATRSATAASSTRSGSAAVVASSVPGQSEVNAVVARVSRSSKTDLGRIAALSSSGKPPAAKQREAEDAESAIRGIGADDDDRRGPRRKNLRDRSVGTAVNPGMIYTFEPQSDQEARREAASQARSRDLAAAEAEKGRLRANERLLRGVGGRLGRTMPYTEVDRAHDYAPAPQMPRSSGLTADNARPPLAETLTPAQQREQGRIQREREARRTPAAGRPYQLPQASRAALESAGPGSRYRPLTDADIERATSNRVAIRESQTVSAARTSRTGASVLGGFFLGGGKQRIADENALTESIQKTRNATRELVVAESRLSDPKVVRDTVAKKHATQEVTAAQHRLTAAIGDEEQARRRVESYSGLKAGVRNLVGATLGGAAFGLGMEALGEIQKAVVPAIEHFVDIQTGSAATSGKVTSALGTETLALKGYADAALAAAEAQAGLSSSASDLVSAYLKVPTQVKAGAQAMAQAGELLRAASGASGAQSGTYGGYGGILGSGLLGQQLGGGMGYSEQIAQNLGAVRQRGIGTGPSDVLNAGLAFATDSGVRKYTLNHYLGSGGGGDFAGRLLGASVGALPIVGPTLAGAGVLQPGQKSQPLDVKTMSLMVGYALSLNDNMARGAKSLGSTSKAMYTITQNADAMQQAASIAAQAGDWSGVESAMQGLVLFNKQTGKIVSSVQEYNDALRAGAVGSGIQSPDQMAQAALAASKLTQAQDIAGRPAAAGMVTFEMQKALPSMMNAIDRQFQRQVDIQQPAQAALGYLAAPPVAAGVGLPVASAADAALVKSSVEGTAEAQKQLNAYYEQGAAVLRDTYGVSQSLIDTFTATGKAIQSVQSGMASRDAAQQAAQYNYQLMIAKQQMGDISGLAGVNLGYGQTQIGVLERENLLLGRQSQMLAFQMQQRQINFNIAQAGFQVPGQTAAQQAANVAEAKYEASFQQRQLNNAKAQFSNQVKIVDLSNLRAAQNMARSIALTVSGHRVSLLDAADAQRLARLNAAQQITANKVNAQMTKVEGKAQALIGYWTQLEAAAGKSIAASEVAWVAAAYNIGKAWYLGATGSGLADVPGGTGSTRGASASNTQGHAAGFLGTTTGSTSMIVGEAGAETVAVLRNPRAMMVGGGNGGGTVVVDVHDNTLSSEGDMNTLVRKIVVALGRDSAVRGMRTPN